ncbi:TobH protein [Mycobacterium sp. 1274756.6]|uniref:TobH protein n=1 Tax=Mycobacterium sp. 1274756.6 TaxID=1834076 RepID=UPI0007FBF2EC|nr:TobH protein [Mycobacterium sp. 1274756.6]OBJ71090.1 TobH protein [Mycobacterium sp. 1274756.6]
MTARHAAIDLDDGDDLLAADTDGLLRATAMAGAQVRAVAAAVEEGALATLGDDPARTLIHLAGRGGAGTAGALLAATQSGSSATPLVQAGEVPPWIGPLDVLLVAGDDPADPALVTGAATGVRRGARVVIAAPYEGPLRDAAAGRAAVLAPRIAVPDEFRLAGHLAAGLAALGAVGPRTRADLAAVADALDAEALRDGPAREVFTNPAKNLAERLAGRSVALAGDDPTTLALARHGSAALLRIARTPAAAGGLGDAVAALRSAPTASIFHDDQIDGPAPARLRVLALALAEHRTVVAARVAGLADVDLVTADDTAADDRDPAAAADRVPAEQQAAVLAVRLELAAVYLRLRGERRG